MKIKKLMALMLCGALSISALSACGNDSQKESSKEKEESKVESKVESKEEAQEEENPYEEKISFTMASCFSLSMADSGIDYKEDPLYDYICEKFNVEIDLWTNTNGEKASIWMSSGDMPDVLWHGGYPSVEAEQGLLRGLPEEWETRWPNIASMVKATGAGDVCKVDGVTYAIPHAIVGAFTDTEVGYAPNGVFFRKDMAAEVGMADFASDGTATVSEFEKYLTAVKDAGLVEVPMEGGDWGLRRTMNYAYGLPSDSSIMATDEAYVFVPSTDAYAEMIAKTQEFYKNGLLDPDYYNESDADSKEDFASGQAAALPWAGSGADIWGMFELYKELTGEDAADALGLFVLTNDDGSYCVTNQQNYWGVTCFNPEVDDAKLERILDIIDWFSTEEGNYALFLGVPGVEFEYIGEGEVNILSQSDRVAGKDAFYGIAWIPGDEWWYTGFSGYDQEIIDMASQYMKVIGEAPNVIPVDLDSDMHKSDAKANYSISMGEIFKELVCGDVDLSTEIPAVVEEYKNMWEPYINELNEAYR